LLESETTKTKKEIIKNDREDAKGDAAGTRNRTPEWLKEPRSRHRLQESASNGTKKNEDKRKRKHE